MRPPTKRWFGHRAIVTYERDTRNIPTVNVNNAVWYRVFRFALVCKTLEWRTSRLYDERRQTRQPKFISPLQFIYVQYISRDTIVICLIDWCWLNYVYQLLPRNNKCGAGLQGQQVISHILFYIEIIFLKIEKPGCIIFPGLVKRFVFGVRATKTGTMKCSHYRVP
jgi:hypothetical protein